MKALRSRKLAALALAVVLLAGMLPVGASALIDCTGGKHHPGNTLYPANWNSQTGGYGYDYYFCTVCGAACHANGVSAVFVGPDNGCSGGGKCHVPNLDDPYETACNSNTDFYYCQACKKVVDADGTIADVSTLGGHTHGDSEKPADYKPCVGGYESSYYICTKCQSPCKADGSGAPYTRGTGIHTPGNTQYPANWNSNDGGYKVAYYMCVYCDQACDIDGIPETFVGPDNACAAGHHTPKMDEKHEADYTDCNGGFECEWYECTQCHEPCDANGNVLVRQPGTGTHHFGELHKADYTDCNGGYKSDWYECEVCHQSYDVEGKAVEWKPGTGKHTPGDQHELNYTPCDGGVKSEWFECRECHQPCDAEGNELKWEQGTGKHTPNKDEQNDPNYTLCGGGFDSDWYVCKDCGQPCDAAGKTIDWKEGTGKHTLSEKHEADYTSCGGGYQSEWYECEVCRQSFDADGNTVEWKEATERHTPGDQQESNYTPCSGGFQGEWYECARCGQPCDVNGDNAEWAEPEAPHTMIERPEQAPTYESEGHRAYWECEVCRRIFRDADGNDEIWDWEEIVLRLTMETAIEDLKTVPEAVAKQYQTVEDILKALLEKALSGNSALKKENTNSVLMDVSLRIKNANDELIPVEPDNFPEEGVEVLLPYPEGTNRTYTFVITHMITSGDHAGEIEVLNYQAEADGLRVLFTSMSPVCIAYQAGSSSTVTIIAGDTTSQSGSNPATGAAGGQTLPVLLWGGALMMALAAQKKRK